MAGHPLLGDVDDIARIVTESRANRVIVASPIALREFVESLVLANELKVRVDVVPELYEIFIGTVDAIVGDVPLMEISHATVPRYFALIKRAADIFFSIVALVFASPVVLLSTIAIDHRGRFPRVLLPRASGAWLCARSGCTSSAR